MDNTHNSKDCDYCEAVVMPHGKQLCRVCEYQHEGKDTCEIELVELVADHE